MPTVERISVLIKSAGRKVGDFPCKDCKKRHPGCSGHCEDYSEHKKKLKTARSEALFATQGRRLAEDLQIKGWKRAVDIKEKKRTSMNIMVKVPRPRSKD